MQCVCYIVDNAKPVTTDMETNNNEVEYDTVSVSPEALGAENNGHLHMDSQSKD